MELFLERFSTPSPSPLETKLTTSAESIARSITEFHYDPIAKSTFCTWFSHFEDLFRVEFKEQADNWKVGLLLRKLGLSEHDQYANRVLPKHPRDYNFDETVETLRKIFGEQISLFNMHFNCLNIMTSDSTDFSTYAGILNRECEQFKIASIIDAQFKSLIFVCGLRPHRGISASRSCSNLQGTAYHQHTLWTISIHPSAFWSKISPCNISADHGHNAHWHERYSSVLR